jgi:hypothetical protein
MANKHEQLIKDLRKDEYLLPDWVDPWQYINEPDWTPLDTFEKHPHDWTKYIPESIRSRWDDLSDETKLIIYALIDEIASNEEWD